MENQEYIPQFNDDDNLSDSNDTHTCKKCGNSSPDIQDGICFRCWLKEMSTSSDLTEQIENSPSKEEKRKLASILKAILFNILGFYAGYYIGGLAVIFAKYLFVDLLGKISFLTSILSWPVEYETYALTGIIFIDAGVSLGICSFISRLGKTKINYSCFVLSAFRVISYISSLITTIASKGFNFSFIWTIVICLIGFIFLTLETANNS